MQAEPFKHSFTTIAGELNLEAINGYLQALHEVYKHIAQVTEFNPAKRMIDGAAILDRIGETNLELMQMLNQEHEELSSTDLDLLNQLKLS